MVMYRLYLKFRYLIARKGEKGEPSSGYLSAKVRDIALELIKDVSGKLLEVGCGEGLFISALLKENDRVTAAGVDMDQSKIEKAAERSVKDGIEERTEFTRTDGESLPFLDNEFDLAVAINLFYNISEEKMESILSETKRVTKKDGLIVFDIRNSMNVFNVLRYKLAPLYDKSIKEAGIKFKTYRPKKIAEKLNFAGMNIVKQVKTGWFMPQAYVIAAKKDNE